MDAWSVLEELGSSALSNSCYNHMSLECQRSLLNDVILAIPPRHLGKTMLVPIRLRFMREICVPFTMLRSS